MMQNIATTQKNHRFIMSACRCEVVHPCPTQCEYRVAWSLNPHMKVGSVAPGEAEREHRALRRAIEDWGGQVITIPFVHGAYDSVFVKDTGVLVERASTGVDGSHHGAHAGRPAFVLGTPRFPERSCEQEHREASLKALGIPVISRSTRKLEGGDFAWVPSDGFGLLGYGFRSERSSALDLSQALGAPVFALELRDPWLYHLDVALGVLSDGTCFACPEAFTRLSWSTLESLFPGDRLVPVPRAEALQFGLNWVEVPGGVLMSDEGVGVARRLRERGWRTRGVPLGRFHAAGGSAACLVNRIWELDQAPRFVATRPTAQILSASA